MSNMKNELENQIEADQLDPEMEMKMAENPPQDHPENNDDWDGVPCDFL